MRASSNKVVNFVFGMTLLAYTTVGFVVLENERNDRLAQDHRRQVASCQSSTALRSLLNDLDNKLKLGDSPSLTDREIHVRIHEYTDNNPNCKGIELP